MLNVQFIKLNQGMSIYVVSAIQFCIAHRRLFLCSSETRQTMNSPVLAAPKICGTQHKTSRLPVSDEGFLCYTPPPKENEMLSTCYVALTKLKGIISIYLLIEAKVK